MDSVEQVMTRGQRAMLVAAYDDAIGGRVVVFLRDRSSTRIVMGLRAKGLSERHAANIDRLTSAGLEVRARLLSSGGEG